MNYNKPPLSVDDQITLLQKRGLMISDLQRAKHYLSTISYYRLRAYTYPFQDNSKLNHPFVKGTTFEHIIQTYFFDRELRLLVFDAIERIEIALRTRMIYEISLIHGSHWYEKSSLYRETHLFVKDLNSIYKEIDRSSETFIEHYRKKYTSPAKPPVWMSLEVTTLGGLSKIYENLRKSPETKAIANYFGVSIVDLLENWMHSLSYVRNICAHHSRLWNRKMKKSVKLPKKPKNAWLQSNQIRNDELYAVLAVIVYLMNIISPGHSWKERLKKLVDKYPHIDVVRMGFPENWQEDTFWESSPI